MIPPNLPDELVAFLADGRQLDYDPSCCEAGKVTLKSLEELYVKEYPLFPEKSAAGRDDPPSPREPAAERVIRV